MASEILTENILVENKLNFNRNIMLWYYTPQPPPCVVSQFAGVIYNINSNEFTQKYTKEYTIYFVGSYSKFQSMLTLWDGLSYWIDINNTCRVEKAKKFPQNIHNLGVYINNYFDDKNGYFNNVTYFRRIISEHKFQTLTESNKLSVANRSAIYLGQVTKSISPQNGESEISFPLLRCSSNLGGPTDNFRETDTPIINSTNTLCAGVFEQKVNMNHVLAQVYTNTNKHKAKIKAHTDKTKDMPKNGVIAFVTFYDFPVDVRYKIVAGDILYKQTSALTQLVFRAKSPSQEPQIFNVILEPGSIFVIPLSTNRLFTHEIKPSTLPADKIPTRLGYVIRCSKTRAIYSNSQTFVLDSQSNRHVLRYPTTQDNHELRKKYFQENFTSDFVDYGDVDFSMNAGDYEEPTI